MRCIFCKADSSESRTIEHIIPESLGNIEHTLSPGIVCDRCNSYFSRKIEKPLLESEYFRQVRYRKDVSNKRGRIPTIRAFHPQSLTLVEMSKDRDGGSVYAYKERESKKLIESILKLKKGTLIIPIPKQPDDYILSRFLGKVALEVLADRVAMAAGGLDEVVDKPELDELRSYVRYGNSRMIWPYHVREIYSEDHLFTSHEFGHYEILHEYILLYTEVNELYLVLALFGVEYALNLGGPEITGYVDWLNKMGGESPLYASVE